MKVLMIGHSGAGKTSFMAGMYKRLGEERSGYGMHTTDEEQHMQLKRLADRLSRGQYPEGTDVQSSYLFNFTRNGKSIMPIEWIDYRGGALTSTDKDDKELKVLTDQIADSDALIIFLDGTKLNELRWETQCEFDIIISCVELALKKERKHWLPISMVITKADLITVDDDLLKGLHYFDMFLENAQYSDVVKVSVSRCTVTQDDCESTIYPFLFAMDGILPNYIVQCREEEAVCKKEYKEQSPCDLIEGIFFLAEQLLEWAFVIVSFILQKLLKWIFGINMNLWSWTTHFKWKYWKRQDWKEATRNRKHAEKRVKKVDKDIRKYIKKQKFKIYGK